MAKGKGFQGKTPPRTRYWVYGTHAVSAALTNPDRRIHRRVATQGHAISGHRFEIVDAKQLEKWLPAGAVHQGVALEVDPLEPASLEEVSHGKATLLMLDQVTDPHNVGAILRSAAAFGVAGVIVPKDNAPAESGALAKAACGALDMVPMVVVTNLAQSMDTLKKAGYWIAGLDGEASKDIAAAHEYKPLCVVMGAEGKGLRRLSAERCDVLLKIPMDARMESLNVSNAAAIALYAAFTGS